MNYALKELVGALRPRFTLLVGQSKHVGFRHDRLVWQKSVPKEPAWRVVLAELDSPNPVFSFGLLREEPADDQLAHWADVCLDQRPRALVQVHEIVIARKLWERSAQMTGVLAHHSLRISHPAAGFDAGIHFAKFADDVLRNYLWEAGYRKSPPIRAAEGWHDTALPPMLGAAGLDWKATTWLTLASMRRHLQFHGLATEGIDTEIVWIRKQMADDQAASSTDAGT